MCVGIALAVAAILVGQQDAGMQIPETSVREPLVDVKGIAGDLQLFATSERETETLLAAARALRDYCRDAMLDGQTAPSVLRIRDALVGRGLEYRDPVARAGFVAIVDVLLFDQPLKQLPILRDAMNDPDSLVRVAATQSVEYWIAAAVGSETRSPWPVDMHKTLARSIDAHIDEIVDLVVWKCLTDAETWNFVRLDLVQGNRKRARSLGRAISSGSIRDANALRQAKSTLERWDPEVGAAMRAQEEARARASLEAANVVPADPFAPNLPSNKKKRKK